MKIAFAGKGGTGKTTLAAWTGEYLARRGFDVWLVDADTALCLGTASGISPENIPVPLVQREDIIVERIGQGLISLTPDVEDLPEKLAVRLPPVEPFPGVPLAGERFLLVMGSIAHAGEGCACGANALLKALLAHVILDKRTFVIVDLEAGVEHLGRGTIMGVDGLVVVSEPSVQSLSIANAVCALAKELGLERQVLALNKIRKNVAVPPPFQDLPSKRIVFPFNPALEETMLLTGSVMGCADAATEESLRTLLAFLGVATVA